MKDFWKLVYRLSAMVAGIGWAICILATIVPGAQVFRFLSYVSGHELAYHPMLDYWMKMAGIAFAFIGGVFIVVALDWSRFLPFGKYMGTFQVLSGIGVLLAFMRLGITTPMVWLDSLFFFSTGLGLLISHRMIKAHNP